MANVIISLSEDKLLELKEMAAQLGVAPEELVRANIEDMLARRDQTSDASVDTKTEAKLLNDINQELPEEVEQRYVELNGKRWAENLTPDEHSELLDLVERVEGMQARRIKSLAELARIRKTSLTELMESLDIKPRVYE